jgi:signal transduction histidine kinase
LRTPVATILGNGLLLMRKEDRMTIDDRRQAIADIVGEAEKLQEDIEHLLILSRLESGTLDIEPLSPGNVVRKGIGTFRERHPQREVTLEGPGELAPVLGQEILVTLVLQNLLTNADKYSPIEQSIDVSYRTRPAGEAEVVVSDRGIGIDDIDLANMFTPFYRSDRARTKAGGLGLGLAVCKRALELQGGTIGARSRTGGGAEFFFTLPPVPAIHE